MVMWQSPGLWRHRVLEHGPGLSPRRRCSAAASAAMAAMVHSPRVFASTGALDKRDPTAQTLPSPCLWSTPELESHSNRCTSPVQTLECSVLCSEDENEDEVTILRHQVALLAKSLEDEKKRRASEQLLMQTKIVELQSIVSTGETTQVRRTLNDEEHYGCLHQVEGDKLQLTRLRAKMHAIVIDSQRETQTLRAQLEGAKRCHIQREKQLTLETSAKVAALEQKHIIATTQLTQQVAKSAAQVEELQAEKHELMTCMQAQQERLDQLELALSGKQLVDRCLSA